MSSSVPTLSSDSKVIWDPINENKSIYILRHGLCEMKDWIVKCILYTCKMFAYEWNMV